MYYIKFLYIKFHYWFSKDNRYWIKKTTRSVIKTYGKHALREFILHSIWVWTLCMFYDFPTHTGKNIRCNNIINICSEELNSLRRNITNTYNLVTIVILNYFVYGIIYFYFEIDYNSILEQLDAAYFW